MKQLYFLSFLIIFLSCNDNKNNTSTPDNNDFAQHFHIQHNNNYDLLEIDEAWPGGKNLTYILSKTPHKIPDSLQKYPIIKLPLKRLILTSTTYLPALEMLQETEKLIAFPHTEYISSPSFRKRVEENKIIEIGSGIQLNTEKVLTLQTQLIMAFSSGQDQSNYQIFQQNNIPVIYNADWMEKTPLGRAEWLKVFGLLFDKEKEAERIFNQIKTNYLQIKQKIKTKKEKPTVFQGGLFGDKWFVPGGKSYAAQLIKDAGGNYLWNNDTQQGSLKLNYENVLLKLPQANVWLNPGMANNKTNLLEEIPQLNNFKSYQTNRIYTYNLKKGKTGGVLYFEQATAHPDWVLSDLYHIFYPSKSENYTFHFYNRLP